MELSVNTPHNPQPFSTGKKLHVYEYEQKYEELEKQALQKQQEHEKQLESVEEENKYKISQSLEPIDDIEPPVDREVLLIISLF